MNLVYPNESDWVRGTDDNELTFYGHHCLISKLDEFLLLQFLYFAFWQPLVNGNEASSKAKFNRLTKLAPIIFKAIFSLRWFLCSTRIRKTFLISQAHFSHTSNYFISSQIPTSVLGVLHVIERPRTLWSHTALTLMQAVTGKLLQISEAKSR